MIAFCKRISKSSVFNAFVVFAIVFASALVGVETYPSMLENHGDLLHRLDALVLFFFSVEIFIKMMARGRRPWLYFYDSWNVFDFVIVALCFMPMHIEYAAAFRLVRILRVLRLVTVLPQLQLLVGALLKSIPSISYVSMLLILLFYVYAVLGTFLFQANDPIHFGTLPMAMVSLFRVVTLEDWTDIMYIQMFGSDKYNPEAYAGLETIPESYPIIAVFYFVSFVLLGTMIILNLFVGVILNGMQQLQEEAHYEKIAETQRAGKLTIADEIKLLSLEMQNLNDSLDALHYRARKANSSYRGLRLRSAGNGRNKQLRVVKGGGR